MIQIKYCNICKTQKPLSDFYKCSRHKDGLSSNCKDCVRKMNHIWWEKNREIGIKKRKEYYSLNKDKYREYSRRQKRVYTEEQKEKAKVRRAEYYKNNLEKIKESHKKYQQEHKDKVHAWQKKYRDNNKNKILEQQRRYRDNNRAKINAKAIERLHNDPKHQMKERTRNMLRYALRSKNHRKNSHTKDILGCDINFFCDYLFKTWEKRYGKKWDGEPYHIDHIVPLATAKNETDILRLCHYTNLQMLTPEENMSKKARLDWE